MAPSVSFWVPGQPRPYERPARGRGNTYVPPREKEYRARVRAAAEAALPDDWQTGLYYDVVMVIVNGDLVGRDIDNIAKSTKDALNKRVWDDDRQVRSEMLYRDIDRKSPGIYIQVTAATQWSAEIPAALRSRSSISRAVQAWPTQPDVRAPE